MHLQYVIRNPKDRTDTMSAAAPFLYSALEAPDTIRLLMIEDKEPSDLSTGTVRCTIQQFRFADIPPYRALSYAWGGQQTKQITLNGCPMQIRTNLWNALANLRQTGYGVQSPGSEEATSSDFAKTSTSGRLGVTDGRAPIKSSGRVKQNFPRRSRELFMNVARRVNKEDTNWIWIDALRINQNSNEERNHQVRLIGQIYAEASEVLV